MKKVRTVFWLHFLIATISHFFAITIPIGLLDLIIRDNNLGFFIKSLMFGVTFYVTIFMVNHVTSETSFCVLNHLENLYRKKAGMPEVPADFMPRYYRVWRSWGRKIANVFRRSNNNLT